MRITSSVALFAVACATLAIIFAAGHHGHPDNGGERIRAYLDKSVPYVGADAPRTRGIDGTGIRIAVIDTGVDFDHPDLHGWGPNGKVVGGYNFIQKGEPPLDTNGHGTQVAGVIAADGRAVGIAPKSQILAYKVSEDGEAVSSELIGKAIEMAVRDGADIINISLGINKTNPHIDRAVRYAAENEILVVTAAGNDGPGPGSIGSPGRNAGSVTVGATYNNLTSSMVATLEVGDASYVAIPMADSPRIDGPITGRIVDGGYGRPHELQNVAADGAIVIVQRGSDIEGELLYFSAKEKNAAAAGARALIVYNNVEGIFLGELIHEFIEEGYEPRIPTVSVDRDEGLKIVKAANGSAGNGGDGGDATLHVFHNPDFVTPFSSRGPVSPFYIKPEIVAPGSYINTTSGSDTGYNLTSGTSYAAPHVSGAAALLLQENPGLHHHEIRSILLTTAAPVSDARGERSPVSESGSGRLDIAAALGAGLVVTPPNFVATTSPDSPIAEQRLGLGFLDMDGGVGGDSGWKDITSVEYAGPEFVRFSHVIEGNGTTGTATLTARMDVAGDKAEFGTHDGRITITHRNATYTVPFLLHHTPGSVSAVWEDGKLLFDVHHPEGWGFAKISVTDAGSGRTVTATATPDRRGLADIPGNAEYWIDAKIRSNKNSSSAFAVVTVGTPEGAGTGGIGAGGAGGGGNAAVTGGGGIPDRPWAYDPAWTDVPDRQILIVAVVAAAAGAAGMLKRIVGGDTQARKTEPWDP